MITFNHITAFVLLLVVAKLSITFMIESVNMQHRRIENSRSMERIERETNENEGIAKQAICQPFDF